MNSKHLIISILFLSALTLTGCDFVRSSLGRPTSADLELKRQYILEEKRLEAEEQARLEAAEKYQKDSLAAWASFSESGCQMKLRSDLSVTIDYAPEKHFCIIAGAFGNPSNAEKLQFELWEKGYDAEILVYRSGIRAVGVTPTDDIVELYSSYEKLLNDGTIPRDAWILINE